MKLAEMVATKNNGDSPVQAYRTVIDDSGGQYTTRLLVGTPTLGNIRMEWAAARFGATIPMNWSYVGVTQWYQPSYYVAMNYMVADAQNMIVREVIDKQFEWLLLIEDDVVIPPDTLLRLNQYIRAEDTPVVSGLYFTRGRPSEPLVFRGRGTSVYTDWEFGDKVWADGVPTGILLIHAGILREMWKDAEEYEVSGQKTRRVFDTPQLLWYDKDSPGISYQAGGTSDLNWCSRVMQDNYFAKAGWPQYQDKEYPFLVDTNIFCKHINPDGEQFP